VRAEAAIVTAELRSEASGAMVAAAVGTSALVLLALAVAFIVAAFFVAVGADWVVVLVGSGVVLALLAGIAAFIAVRAAPKSLVPRAREQVATDIRQIGDHAI